MSKNGLILLTPTSIAYTGTSATISTNGSVLFSGITSLSFNGVFTNDYDNYLIIRRSQIDTDDFGYSFRLRASGTDDTASNYVTQRLYASDTSYGGARYTSSKAYNGVGSNDQRDGQALYVYGPYLAQPTAWRQIHVGGYLNAYIDDFAGTHNQTTAYDGITFYPDGNSMSGRVAIYGMRK